MNSIANKIIRYKIHFYILVLLFAGLVFSPYLNGVMYFVLFGFLLLSIPKPFLALKENTNLKILILFYVIHIIGILGSSNWSFALNDLRIKAAFILFPFVFASFGGINKKQWNLLIWSFSLFVFIATIFSYALYFKNSALDTRNYSVFISHIRFSLIVLSLFFFHLIQLWNNESKLLRQIRIITMIYLFVFLLFLSSLTSLLLIPLLFSYIIHIKWRKPKAIVFIALAWAIPLIYFTSVLHDYIPKKSFEQSCEANDLRGNENYFLRVKAKENGYFVGINLNEASTQKAWNKISNQKIDTSISTLNLKYTIYRYLSSKNLPKDSSGITQLSDFDIRNIENGISNYTLISKSALYKRIYTFIWEIDRLMNNENVSGHTFTQRIIYWQTALELIKAHPWIGVGTGNMPEAYEKQYDKDKTTLAPEFQLRAHNQYLSFLVAFGIPGGLLVLFSLIWPFITQKKKNPYFVLFFIIMAISMLTEDSIETQAGATFFGLFYSLFLFSDNDL